jgi:hypothetical protein
LAKCKFAIFNYFNDFLRFFRQTIAPGCPIVQVDEPAQIYCLLGGEFSIFPIFIF